METQAPTPRRHRLGAAPCLLVLLAACGSTGTRPVNVERDLQDPYAGRRVTAIATVEARGDREQVPALIELLDDRDPGVRLAAYSALQDLTGRDTGYRPWADEAERRAAVLAWRAWWKETHPEGVSAPPEGGP